MGGKWDDLPSSLAVVVGQPVYYTFPAWRGESEKSEGAGLLWRRRVAVEEARGTRREALPRWRDGAERGE